MKVSFPTASIVYCSESGLSRSLQKSYKLIGSWTFHRRQLSFEHRITGIWISIPSGKHGSLLPASFQTQPIKSGRLGHGGPVWSVIIRAVYLPAQQLVTKRRGMWISAGDASPPLQSLAPLLQHNPIIAPVLEICSISSCPLYKSTSI